MAEDGKGVGGFLKGSTGPLPNWAWIVVIGGGIAAAIILPKFFGASQGTGSQTASNTGTSDQSGLGLAIDPTTGLPYAVEGLVPSGGTTGGTGGGGITPQPPVPVLPVPPTPTPTPPPNQPPPPNPAWVPLYSSLPGGYNPQKGVQPLTINGQLWTVGPGSNGIVWGVKGNIPTQQWLNTPIGVGQKQVLFQAAGNNALMPQTTQPNWPGGITQTRVGV